MTDVTIGVLFPATFNLNGDAANATVLARRLSLSGHDTVVVHLDADSVRDGASVDALIIGSPSSTGLTAPECQSSAIRGFIAEAIQQELPLLAVSNGFHLLGRMTAKDGTDLGGLGLVPAQTTFGPRQHVTIGARIDTAWGSLVGVENHNATVKLEHPDRAFGTVQHGVGNNSGGVDGYHHGLVFATHLHGPVFAMNPAFADHFTSAILGRLGETYRRGVELDELDRLSDAAAAHLVRTQK